MIFTLANGLTYSRLVLLPFVMVGIVTHHGWLAVVMMILMWITDLLDGRAARLAGQASPAGKTLDSTVDFVLIYLLFTTFYAAGRLTTVQFAFLYLALLAMLSLQLVTGRRGGGGEVVSTSLSKLTGGMQYAYLIFLVFLEVLPSWPWLWWLHAVYFVLLASAIVLFTLECGWRIAQANRAALE